MNNGSLISLVLAALFANGCSAIGATGSVQAPSNIAGGPDVTVSIQAGVELSPANKNVFGNDVNWVEDAWHMWDAASGTFHADAAQAIVDLAPPFLRYPGGLLANVFHWAQALPDDRAMQPDLFGTMYLPTLGVYEFYERCAAWGIEPMFTLNVSTGTAEEAAALVAYLNGDAADTRAIGVDTNGTDWQTVGYWANRRTNHGRPQPFDATYFELGNEQWDAVDMGGLPVDTYVARAVAFTAAIQGIDPSIRAAVVGYHQLLDPGVIDAAAGSTTPWNQSLFEGLQNAQDVGIDGVVQHYYVSIQGWTPPDVYAAEVLTAYVDFENGFDAFENQILTFYPRNPNLDVWFTEWNRATLTVLDHSVQDALYVADFGLNTLGQRSRIVLGNVYTMGNGGYGVFFAGDGVVRPVGTVIRHPTFHAISLINAQLTGVRLVSEVTGPRFDRPDRGDPPMVRVLATKDQATRTLKVFVVNKGNGPLNAEIDIVGVTPGSTIIRHTLGGTTYDANNLDPKDPDRVVVVSDSITEATWPLQTVFAGPGLLVLEVPYSNGDGDFNLDGNVDLADFAQFEVCFTGPGGGPVSFGCEPGDFDGDNDIDCDDWNQFVQAWTERDTSPQLAQCSAAIPAASEWGMCVMTVAMLTTGTAVLDRRRSTGETKPKSEECWRGRARTG